MREAFTNRNLLIALAAAVIVAGAAFLFTRPATDTVSDAADASSQIWTCSMHPQVRLSKPGKCPICSMPLVPATARARTNDSAGSMLELSEHARTMASVETVPVERRKMSREIRAVGKVQYNETGLANITTRVEGYVERLFVDYTGVEVNRGDHLVEI